MNGATNSTVMSFIEYAHYVHHAIDDCRTGYGVKSMGGGTDMLSRQDWVEIRGAATGERRRHEACGRGVWEPSPEIWKNDCRERDFEAFQTLSSHFEGVSNSKETPGELNSDQ